jgi:hypothetical protein
MIHRDGAADRHLADMEMPCAKQQQTEARELAGRAGGVTAVIEIDCGVDATAVEAAGAQTEA